VNASTRWLLFLLAWVLAACTRPPETEEPGLDLTLRFDLPGQACLDQGFVGWMVEVRQGSVGGPIVASAYIEPFAFPIEGDFVGLEGDEYIFSDYWVGVLPAGDYHVRAYGVTDPGPPPVIASFMTPAEAMVTLIEGETTEIVLVTSCENQPGALDVIVVVDGGPALLDFDIDMKWVSVCQATTFSATLANPERDLLTAMWVIRDETGAMVLHETQVFPAGTPDPIVTSFVAWLPEPGDYEGTLTVTSSGSTSVFAFPWHVRFPGIAVGACTDDDGDPVVLLSCDPDDGLDLVDDPACLDAAFGSTGGVLPTCVELVIDECDGGLCPGDADTDGDGVCDASDPCPTSDPDDSDGDGTCDADDGCPGGVDTDGDQQCDETDPCPTSSPDDADGDGRCDDGDSYPCPGGGPDSDGDFNPDACDLCPADPLDDVDFDGVCDSDDECPGVPDVDADHDGVTDCVETCTTNCTFTIGYWRNHPENWPIDSLVVGNRTYTKRELLDILRTPPKGNASIILAYQFIAARLNAAYGADTGVVSGSLTAAQAWFVLHAIGSATSGSVAQQGIDLGALLDAWNNGLVGPGHCDMYCEP